MDDLYAMLPSLRLIVRAHEVFPVGHRWFNGNRVLTVFSAPNYCGQSNSGAFLNIDHNGNTTIKQINVQ